jgi:pimeloyl-ACP methyl ester carboxylesterase
MSTAWLDLMGTRFCQKFYQAGEINTRCLEAGSGEPLILLHGGGGYAEAYLKNLIPLSETFHVYAIDMIGHGFTDAPDVEYGIPLFVEHLKNFMDAAGLDQAHISGESWGGWVAAWMAIKHPDRVKKLMLNTTAGIHETGTERTGEMVARNRALGTGLSRETVRKRLEWLFYKPEDVTEEMVEVRFRIYSRPEVLKAVVRTIDWAMSEEHKPYRLAPEIIERIKSETSVVWTRHNPGTTMEAAEEKLHKPMPHWSFHVMEECGHWPQWEQPEEFNRLVKEFFSSSSN